MARVKVCKVEDLKREKVFRVDTKPAVAVFFAQGRFYAVADLCTHATASMSEGYLEEDDLEVECPIHSARFCLKSGKAMCLPATEPLQTFVVDVEGDEVFIEVPQLSEAVQ